jgi:hypothetical protein
MNMGSIMFGPTSDLSTITTENGFLEALLDGS